MEISMKAVLTKIVSMAMVCILSQMEIFTKANSYKDYNMVEAFILTLEPVLMKDNGLMEERKGKDLCMHMETIMKVNGTPLKLAQANILGRMEIHLKVHS